MQGSKLPKQYKTVNKVSIKYMVVKYNTRPYIYIYIYITELERNIVVNNVSDMQKASI